ncbi:MAG: adenylyl-sulfate kinase [Candidatus Obscuribacterales bacterium]|nr:adenylyl-sulfate kinase [Candidatus Obscuribacterales bacterium]
MRKSKDLRRIVVVGHVDHGKSTLLARIMLQLECIPEDKIQRVQDYCQSKGSSFEPAFLLDAFHEEQEQGVSIETTQAKFEFKGNGYLLVDAPGHLEFLKNMTTGASGTETALLLVDCQQGIRSQTLRHLKVLEILGLSEIIVVINKMDEVAYSQEAFDKISTSIKTLISAENLHCQAVVPVSAYLNENIDQPSAKLPWYKGLPLLETLAAVCDKQEERDDENDPFRMILQDVYRFENKRHFAGRVVSGQIKPGSAILFSPSGKISTVTSIEKYPNQVNVASSGESIALQLDEQVYVERGEIISFPDDAPEVDKEILGRAIWLSQEPFIPGATYTVKIGTMEAPATVHLIDTAEDLAEEPIKEPITNGSFVDVLIRSSVPLAFDRSIGPAETRCFVICSETSTLAAGSIDIHARARIQKSARNRNITAEKGYTERQKYETKNGHRGTVLWLTGLPGAGKSSLAKALEHHLFANDYHVVALDADNLRAGISSDLGFSAKDRSENIRRIGQVAKLFLDTGSIVIVACISPFSADREAVRNIVGADDFKEIFVYCPIEACQKRDPKGLYQQANSGKLKSMTGVTSSYQPPRLPALKLDSTVMSIEEEVQAVLELLLAGGIIEKPNSLTSATKAGNKNKSSR